MLKIAYRYLRSPKTHSAVNIITNVSIAGVAVATMAMVIVLSIFNGFSDLAADRLSMLDADITVSRSDFRVIADADSLAQKLSGLRGVKQALPTLSGRALMTTNSAQSAVRFRGVPDGYDTLTDIESALIDGQYAQYTTHGVPAAVITIGVANNLRLGITSAEDGDINLHVPRRVGRINPANPAAAFHSTPLTVAGVMSVNQPEIDYDFIIMPLSTARDILEYDTEASDIEIFTEPGTDISRLQDELTKMLGDQFTVRDSLQLHAESFKMIAIEKWVTFMMLIFILAIALFNIVSTLSLLIIEKRENSVTLRFLGATRKMIVSIFVAEGWLVTCLGGLIGILLGVILTLAQQWGHFIPLSADASALTINYYPVALRIPDLLAVMGAVIVTGLIASQSTRLFIRTSK